MFTKVMLKFPLQTEHSVGLGWVTVILYHYYT